MEKCIKKLMIAAVLMSSLVPIMPVYAMDGNDSEEEASFAEATAARTSFAEAMEAGEEEVKERESAPARQISFDEMRDAVERVAAMPSIEEKEREIDIVIESIGGIDVRDELGCTLLMHSICSGNKELLFLLFDRNADISPKNDYGSTPLKVASRGGHNDIVQLLLDKSANIEETDRDGVTPLMSASRANESNTVRILLNRGANIYACDIDNRTVLKQAATRFDNAEVVGVTYLCRP